MGILTDEPMMGVLSGEDNIKAAVKRERAACAKIARAEAKHQRALANKQPYTDLGERSADRASHRAATAERIARAIERGDR